VFAAIEPISRGAATVKKSFVKGARAQTRAYSPAVMTEGGKIIWLAGHTGAVDDSGKSLAGDFEAQCRQTFRNIEKTLAEAGAKLSDLVTMTVFLSDTRHTTRMTELRREIFGDNFAASAAITVTGFAQPEMLIEIQSVAVVPA
jgi:enamine deaminase RidA (YjgF/YER057c/UK114 family)